MAWAKIHGDILGDPKLMRAARQGHQGLQLLPWLIAFAKQANDQGRLTVGGQPVEPADLVPLIPGTNEADIAQCLASATAIGVLITDPDGALRLAKWEDRQAKPSDSREAIRARVRRHRERRKGSRKPPQSEPQKDVTPHPRYGALHVTPDVTPSGALQPPVTPCNATEKRNPTGFRDNPVVPDDATGSVPDRVTSLGQPPVTSPAKESAASPASAHAGRRARREVDPVTLIPITTPEERAIAHAAAERFRAEGRALAQAEEGAS